MEESPAFYMWNAKNVSDVDGYGKAIQTQFDSMKSEAASGVSRKFATRASVAPDISTLYMLVQCTPDLSEQNCSGCLMGFLYKCQYVVLESKVGECIVGEKS